jgi:hypothetical protein
MAPVSSAVTAATADLDDLSTTTQPLLEVEALSGC